MGRFVRNYYKKKEIQPHLLDLQKVSAGEYFDNFFYLLCLIIVYICIKLCIYVFFFLFS